MLVLVVTVLVALALACWAKRWRQAAHAKDRQAILESDARFRKLFENAPIGIYRTTPAGRILMANPVLLRMLGYG